MYKLLFLSIFSYTTFATLPSTAIWEVRTTATAGNVNGGFFNSARGGTDYSQQNAAQETRTDGAASGTTTFTSATATFTSVMVGNSLHITTTGTGLTVGWYEIVTFTDANNVVLDRSPGTGTGATFYVGGALSLNSVLDDALFEAVVGGNTMYIKSGSYTLGIAITVASTAPTSISPFTIIGYTTTRGDTTVGSNRPQIDSAANGTSLGQYMNVKNVSFVGQGSPLLTLGTGGVAQNIKVRNTSTIVNRVGVQIGSTAGAIYDSEIISQNGAAINFNSSGLVFGCYIHDSDKGATVGAASGIFVRNIFEGCKSYGIQWTVSGQNSRILNNTFYGSEAKIGVGIEFASAASQASNFVVNNIFYGLVTGISYLTAEQGSNFSNYNDWFNCTTDVSNWTKEPNGLAVNPNFGGASQLTGSTATTLGQVLTQSGGDFSTVTDNVDFIRVVSGTGVTTGIYLIGSHTSTTVTTAQNSFGTSNAGDVVWVVGTGHNFMPSATMNGFPGAFNSTASETTGYIQDGAVQRSGGETSRTFIGP